MGPGFEESMGPGFENRWDPASNRWTPPKIELLLRMREQINLFIYACAQALIRLFRAQKRTEEAMFEPSTLSMRRNAVRLTL